MCKVSERLAHKKPQYQKHSFFPHSEDFAALSLEFSGNEFEYGKNKIERERESIISST
jgi:hypothetical protein